jgi:4-amino-4-deoxy-L-arabinose transferase-like glycosyltransferase
VAAKLLSIRHWLGLILLGHVLLAVFYSVIIPPWEAHDEWAHFRYAAYIAENLALPDPGQRLTTEFQFDEASQPPLYYLLAAVPMLAADTNDGYRPQVNRYAIGGEGQKGVNLALHDFAAEAWPWSGSLLALHLGRWISVLISTLGLYVTYKLVRLLSPRAPSVALIATGIQAFAPQYVFISSVITNDILLIVLETVFMYLALRLLIEGPTLRLTAFFGLITALALLTKYLALALLPLAGIVLAYSVWLHRKQPGVKRRFAFSLLVMIGFVLVIGGALLLRNQQLTGALIPRDPVSQAAILTGLSKDGFLTLDWRTVPQAFRYGFETYWVSFGWGNVGAPDWVYGVWLTLFLGGLAGLLLWLRSDAGRQSGRLLVVLLLFVVAVVSLPLLRELLHDSSFLRGRYILSTLPLVVWVIAQGWEQISGRAWPWVRGALLIWPAGLTISLALFLVLPAYAPPASLSADAAETLGEPIHANFGRIAELISVRVQPDDEVKVGEGVAVTLTWRVLARTAEPYTLAIHLTSAGNQSFGSVNTYPGHGNAATTVWRPGAIFSETYSLRVERGGVTPTHGEIKINLFDNAEDAGDYLLVYDAQGNAIGDTVRFGSLRIDSPAAEPFSAPTSPSEPGLARFGDFLLLTEARLPDLEQQPGWPVPVLVRWRALQAGPEDVTLSVQLLDAEGDWVAGSDGAPSIELPPQHWRAGDWLHAIRWLDLPPDLPAGRYQVVATLYDAHDLSRVPAIAANGQPLANNAWLVAEITVVEP